MLLFKIALYLPRETKQKIMAKKTKTAETPKYYSLAPILKHDADYNIIFGERSNGKTYAALYYAIERYVKDGTQTAYVRRWREDIRGKRAETLFTAHVANGVIEKLTNNQFNTITYASNKYYLAFHDADGTKSEETPFCYTFALSEQEHEKSTSYPNVCTVIFDEFLTRRYYLPDEFMLFMNVLSTIIRLRDNVKIFMLGNTVNKYCPYFAEFGLKNVPTQKQGTIDIYQFGENGAKVAVEYAATVETKKASNKYFCFDNQNLQMITTGKWELAIYPHLPTKYTPKDVLFKFYICFQDAILQGNIINVENDYFIYIHAKTTPIKDENTALIYSLDCNGKPNYRRRLLSNITDIDTKITKFFAMDKVFYQSNEIGEIVRNYIKVSSVNNLLAK